MHKLTWSLAAVLTFALSGCIAYTDHKTAPASLQLTAGMREVLDARSADVTWLHNHLGAPSQINFSDDGTSVWSYRDRTAHTRQLQALPLLDVRLSDEAVSTLRFRLQDGVVTQYWQE